MYSEKEIAQALNNEEDYIIFMAGDDNEKLLDFLFDNVESLGMRFSKKSASFLCSKETFKTLASMKEVIDTVYVFEDFYEYAEMVIDCESIKLPYKDSRDIDIELYLNGWVEEAFPEPPTMEELLGKEDFSDGIIKDAKLLLIDYTREKILDTLSKLEEELNKN
jgi:hypothetical protein